MNSDSLQWAAHSTVLSGSRRQGVHGLMGFKNILMDRSLDYGNIYLKNEKAKNQGSSKSLLEVSYRYSRIVILGWLLAGRLVY